MTLEDKVHATRLLALRTSRRARQCLGSLPGIGHLPLPVLPLAKSGTGSTVEMGFIPSATRGAEVVPTACRSKTNERFWPWRCRTPRVGPGSTPCSWRSSSVPCLRAPSTGLCVASDWVRGMSGSFSSSVTAPSAADCSPSVRAAGGSELVGKGDTSRPASRESSSVSTRSTSAASRASGRSGRLRPAMRPVPTPWPVSSPPAPATMPCASSSTTCCRSTRPPDGRFSGSSRTEAVNSRAVSMRRVTISGSDIRAPSRATPGRTASSSACRARSFTSIGASPSAAGISPLRSNWTRPCSGSSTSTTTSDPIRATELAATLHRLSSGEPLKNPRQQRSDVSTPFRNWTV